MEQTAVAVGETVIDKMRDEDRPPVAVSDEGNQEVSQKDRPPAVAEEQPGKDPEVREGEAEVSEREEPEKPSVAEEMAALRVEIESLKRSLEAKAGMQTVEALRSESRTTQEEVAQELGEGYAEAQRSVAEMQTSLDGLHSQVAGLQATVRTLVRLVEPEAERDQIDPTTVPPTVLEEAYEQIATEVFRRMMVVHGDAAVSMTRLAMDAVRRSAAGMEFFGIAGDNRILASGLAEALERRSMSAHQINITFREFMRRLLATVPGYQPASLRDLSETGSRAFSVATARELTKQHAEVVERLGRVEAREERFASLESRLGRLGSEIEGSLASFEEQSQARLAEMAAESEESRAKLADMTDQVEQSLAATGERISALEGGLQRVEKSLDSLKKEAAEKPKPPKEKARKKSRPSVKKKGDDQD